METSEPRWRRAELPVPTWTFVSFLSGSNNNKKKKQLWRCWSEDICLSMENMRQRAGRSGRRCQLFQFSHLKLSFKNCRQDETSSDKLLLELAGEIIKLWEAFHVCACGWTSWFVVCVYI